MTAPANLLVLMSDEHNPKFLGAAGHPFIATPNLDALAARGTRFASAYTACPICVPARASFAIGATCTRSATGTTPTLRRRDSELASRAARRGPSRGLDRQAPFPRPAGDDHGFSEEIIPMHIVDGIGDVKG
jgi:choline-sulfatase